MRQEALKHKKMPKIEDLGSKNALVHWSRKQRVNEIFRGFLSPLSGATGVKDVGIRMTGPALNQQTLFRAANSGNRPPRSKLGLRLKTMFLKAQYNWACHYLNGLDTDFLIVWNGIKGHRRLLAESAKEVSLPVVYFEESPFPDRVSVDFEGVNFGCSLPRNIEFYRRWALETGVDSSNWRRLRSKLVPRKATRQGIDQRNASLGAEIGNFIFCPLQVPGDSQITIYGDWIDSVEAFIQVLSEASKRLPDGWHLRIKEHPSARTSFTEKLKEMSCEKLRVDNDTNTFLQVAASQGILNVNSSVGLQAFFFDKPVIALGQAFYAFDELAHKCSGSEELAELLSNPDGLTFNQSARDAFMNYLDQEYYPYEKDLISGDYTLVDAIQRDDRQKRISEKML